MFLFKNSKSKFFQLGYFVDGKQHNITTKQTDSLLAQKFLDDFAAKFNAAQPAKSTSAPVPSANNTLTLKHFRDEYIKHLSQSRTSNYIRSIKLSFKHFIIFTGDIQLNKIDLKLIDTFISSIFARSQSASALYYRTLKAAFSQAEAWEYITVNPFKKLKRLKSVTSKPYYITLAELTEILNNTKDQDLKDIYTTAFYTGMRLSEILNLRWFWLDLQANKITVKNSAAFITKSKQERIIPINPALLNTLKNRMPNIIPFTPSQKDDLVFYKLPGVLYLPDYVSKNFKKACKAAGLDIHIHFHSLRHSFASNLVLKNVNLYTVKELLGHSSITTTEIYSHLNISVLSNAVNQL